MNIANSAIDEMLAQATCAVLVNGRVLGTAWLVSAEGHLLTAGHILGISKPIDKVEIQFGEDVPREAYKVQWGYHQEMGIDFAVLKTTHLPIGRVPLPISLKRELAGTFSLIGYGVTLKTQSSGSGEFIGFFDPQNSPGNRLLLLRSAESGEGGYSGAAIFSDELQAVVAVQVEATKAETGPGRDTILAMPLYRIAQHWEQLLQIEGNSQSGYSHADIFNIRSVLAKLPLPPMFAHPQPPEMHWSDRVQEIITLNNLWKSEQVKAVGFIGLGGAGKSSLARRCYDELAYQSRRPDGFFWWSFYYQQSLDEFLEVVLSYLTGGRFDPSKVQSPWARIQHLITLLGSGRFIIVLDGLEVMQKTAEAGDDFGRLNDTAFRNFLKLCADPALHKSLILITSRFPLTDLKLLDGYSYLSLRVDHFSDEDGAEYLKRRGVKGTTEELQDLSNKYGGHALSLSLIAGYLNEYFERQATEAQHIPTLSLNEKTEVHQILQVYNARLTVPQISFLQILSAFRRPVEHRTFEAIIRDEKFINPTPLLQNLAALKPFELRGMINNLEKMSLISREKNRLGEWCYTTHLIIREYFYKQLLDNRSSWLQLNLQLRDYALGLPVQSTPSCLEDLMSLFDVIYYTCRVGLYDEAALFYRQSMTGKIGHWEVSYKFGAYEFQLSLLRDFFPDRDLDKQPFVTNAESAVFLLLEIAWCFSQLGQPIDAKTFFERAAINALEASDHRSAAIAYYKISEVQSALGELDDAGRAAEKAVELAKVSKAKDWESWSWAAFGWVAFLKGESDSAELAYKNSLLVKRTAALDEKNLFIYPDEDILFFNLGVQYATFLLATGREDESRTNTELNLKICAELNWTEGIARCKRLLGDIALAQNNTKESASYYAQALDISRNFGIQVETWRILLGLSKTAVAGGQNFSEALANLTSALEIADKSQEIIAKIDINNLWSEISITQGNYELAKDTSHKALGLAEKINYEWGRGTALHNLGEALYLLGDIEIAKKNLAMAFGLRDKIKDPRKTLTRKLLGQITSTP